MDDRSIKAEQLVRRFGPQVAVDAVDLEVPSGQVFAFLGPNGAGKTTVVKMLTTILAPTSGSARVAGYDVRRDGQQVRLRIGVALQDVGLDALMTAEEMLILQAQLFGASRGEARERAKRLLVTVGLDTVPPGKRVGQFSGGMKRRLDLALALVHDPSILFLDEPTTGLDPVSRAAVWEEVRRLNRERGITIFLTTQYLEEADELADTVAIIDRGKIATEGSPARLKAALGGESINLLFDSREMAEQALSELTGMGDQIQLDRDVVRLYMKRASEMIPAVLNRLQQASLAPLSLTLTQPTLDDVFLQVTGQRLETQDSPQALAA